MYGDAHRLGVMRSIKMAVNGASTGDFQHCHMKRKGMS